MPDKPECLIPSNSSLQQDVQQQPPHGQAHQGAVGSQLSTPAPATAPPPTLPLAPSQQFLGGQASAQITIRYADGRQEIIDVMNVDHVCRVAHSGQVISPLQASLSASHPQTSHPHPISTSSLPAALVQPADLPPCFSTQTT